MRRFLLYALCALIIIVGWTGFSVLKTLNGWNRTPIAPENDPSAFIQAASDNLTETTVANAFIVLIEDGAVSKILSYSIGTPISEESVFQIASLSKWVTATGVMALASDGLIDLDAPVSTYLKSWLLPPSRYDEKEVTIRRILSHTAGLTDGLGYMGFSDADHRQSVAESLTRATDAMPGASGRVELGMPPGERFIYSGGGYTLLQLMIEDVTGLTFDQYMRERVLLPLGMTDSEFEPDDELLRRLVTSYDESGQTAPTHHFTALAAASLYTTPRDMTIFVLAQLNREGLRSGAEMLLRPENLSEMRSPHATVLGREVYGLGTLLSAKTESGAYVFGHDGRNNPAISTAVRVNPDTSDAIIVLSTGDPEFAAELASEWTFWQVGRPDVSELNSRFGPSTLRAVKKAILACLLFSLIWFAGWIWRQHYTRSDEN